MCERTACTVRCGGGRQPRTVGPARAVRPRKPPADPTFRDSTRCWRSLSRRRAARGVRPRCHAESTSTGDQCLAISAAFTHTGQSRRRHGTCSMLLLLAVSGSLNRLAFHAPLLLEPRDRGQALRTLAAHRGGPRLPLNTSGEDEISPHSGCRAPSPLSPRSVTFTLTPPRDPADESR